MDSIYQGLREYFGKYSMGVYLEGNVPRNAGGVYAVAGGSFGAVSHLRVGIYSPESPAMAVSAASGLRREAFKMENNRLCVMIPEKVSLDKWGAAVEITGYLF